MAATTKERIFAVADQLDAEGKNPTYVAIRRRLGGGSFSTISEALAERKAKLAAKERMTSVEPTPETLADHLNDFGGQIWALALELASKRFSGDRETFEAARAALEEEKAAALQAADEMSAELEQMQAQVVTLEAAELEARKSAETARAQVSGIIERAATAETRALELEKRVTDLNNELVRLNEANAKLVEALAAAATANEPANE